MSGAGAVDDDQATTSSGGSVVARLRRIEGELADLAAGLAPERVPGHLVGATVRELRRIERRAAGARLLLSDAAARTGVWRGEGFRSPEEWLARANGTSVGEAEGELKASKQLGALPGLADAVAKGGDLRVGGQGGGGGGHRGS